MDAKNGFSLQAELIRQIQVGDGDAPCYATPSVVGCAKTECSWRRDCFHEAEGLVESWHVHDCECR